MLLLTPALCLLAMLSGDLYLGNYGIAAVEGLGLGVYAWLRWKLA